jgi:hypothetical protein
MPQRSKFNSESPRVPNANEAARQVSAPKRKPKRPSPAHKLLGVEES